MTTITCYVTDDQDLMTYDTAEYRESVEAAKSDGGGGVISVDVSERTVRVRAPRLCRQRSLEGRCVPLTRALVREARGRQVLLIAVVEQAKKDLEEIQKAVHAVYEIRRGP